MIIFNNNINMIYSIGQNNFKLSYIFWQVCLKGWDDKIIKYIIIFFLYLFTFVPLPVGKMYVDAHGPTMVCQIDFFFIRLYVST